MAKAQTAPHGNKKAHAVEWALGGLSALIVAGLAAFLVYEGVTRTGSEPVLTLHIERLLEQDGGHSVIVTVRNEGHATAADVQIAGTMAGDALVRSVTLDYAPAQSEREITLTFATPVTLEALNLQVLGFVDP